MELKKCVILSIRVSCLLSVLTPLSGNPLKGKFHPIGPGTDAGLYNEGFFEGDIVSKMDVSIGPSVTPGFKFRLLSNMEWFLICCTFKYSHGRTVQDGRQDVQEKGCVQCTETGFEGLTHIGENVLSHKSIN